MLHANTVNSNRRKCGCPSKCDGCPVCSNTNVYELYRLIWSAKEAISSYVYSEVKRIQWGYAPKCISKSDVIWLLEILPALESAYTTLVNGAKSCLGESGIQRVKEKALKIVGGCGYHSGGSDIIIDRSKRNEWIVENPGAALFEEWEYGAKSISQEVNVLVEKRHTDIEAYFNIMASNITPELPQYLPSVYLAQRESVVSSSIKDVHKYEAEFKIIAKHKTCDFGLGTYVKLLKCHLDFNVTNEILKCGMQLRYNTKKKCAEVITLSGKIVDLCSISEVSAKVQNLTSEEIKALISNFE